MKIKYGKKEILEAIQYWEDQLNEGWYDQSELTQDDIVVFSDGKWHDSVGNEIDIPLKQETEILDDIRRIEKMTFGDTSPVGRAQTALDLGRPGKTIYTCRQGDQFIFFKGTRPMSDKSVIHKNAAPNSTVKDLQDTFEVISIIKNSADLLNSYYSRGMKFQQFPVAEILDMTGFTRNSVLLKYVNNQLQWFKKRGVKAFHAGCKKDTSYKLITSKYVERMFRKFGYVNIEKAFMNENQYEFVPMVFVDMDWIKTVDQETLKWLKYKTTGSGDNCFLI